MATVQKIAVFLCDVTQLPSFPVFCGYLLMIFLSGLYQKLTRPIEFRRVMVAYNFLCSFLSIYTLGGFSYGVYASDHIYEKSPTVILRHVFTIYWGVKIIELLDTVFMVLRHRRRQISFLHVFHHSTMVILSDYGRLYSPWPAIAPPLALNSMVHIVLYLYYGLTALDPKNPPQWKRRVTEFQIVQFFIDMVYAFIGYMYHGFCIYGILYGFAMIYLFCSFYYQAYLSTRSDKLKSK